MKFQIKIPSINKIRNNIINFSKEVLFFSTFLILLVLYLTRSFLLLFGKIKPIRSAFQPLAQPLENTYIKVTTLLGDNSEGNFRSVDLIMLAIRNLKVKKTRTIITIGGMALGFGSVVFLLSLGYGTQKLVISRVARLDEMKQADVSIGRASALFLNSNTITEMKNIENVDLVLPMISVVAKISFNNSISDVVAYGVTSDFLEQSAIRTTRGKIFSDKSEELSFNKGNSVQGEVAGVQTEISQNVKIEKEICETKYSINPLVFKPVYESLSNQSEIIGYTRRDVGLQEATEVWGKSYSTSSFGKKGADQYGNYYGQWIKDNFSLWEEKQCDLANLDCVEEKYLPLKENSRQVVASGFITKDDVSSNCLNSIKEINNYGEEGQVLNKIEFSSEAEHWIPVYSQPKLESSLIGYTQSDKEYQGELILGSSYISENGLGEVEKNKNDQWLGYWVSTQFPLWDKLDCEQCDKYYLTQRDENDQQKTSLGYITTEQIAIKNLPNKDQSGRVLAATIDVNSPDVSNTASQSAFTESEAGWVEIASSQSALLTTAKKNIIKIDDSAQRVAIINKAMLSLLGLEENAAIGEAFNTSFILSSELFENDYQAESDETQYKIIGIIPGDKTPAFYLPFTDLNDLGINNFSQVKIVANDKTKLEGVRAAIEGMGFKTSSVADTVSRINGLFDTIRLVLIALGMVALGVAALGMFNTLTVSLLEKTREVGLMKTMGMRSREVQRLFLTESVIMGFLGGVFGIILGFLLGKTTSFFLSMLAVSKGLGTIDITYVPPYLIAVIIILSSLIGIFTGIYPAKRATKISALNALRYE